MILRRLLVWDGLWVFKGVLDRGLAYQRSYRFIAVDSFLGVFLFRFLIFERKILDA